MNTDVDVVVVGAGPTGLLLAGDLARAGVSCVVLERHAERSNLTRAFAVHARTLEQLDARGVADELVATGTPESKLRFLGGHELRFPRLPSRFPYVLITPQYETERVLAGRARSLGADLRYGTQVAGLARFPDRVEVIVRPDGQPEHLIRASYVVGATSRPRTSRSAWRRSPTWPGGPWAPTTARMTRAGCPGSTARSGRFPATATAGSCWPATPPTSTPRRAARA
jgi:2-polyprenyl-6-methoxyphenol hydroxylase-like FAD-dependent oxidoreductase